MISKVVAICFFALAFVVLAYGTLVIVVLTLGASSNKQGFEPIIDTAFPFHLVTVSFVLAVTGIFALIGMRLWRRRT